MQDNLSQEHRTALIPHSAAHALACKDARLIPSDAPQHVHCVAHDEQNGIAQVTCAEPCTIEALHPICSRWALRPRLL
jgi:hypothetical protein